MPISYTASLGLIFGSSVLGLIWGVYNYFTVARVNVKPLHTDDTGAVREPINDEENKDTSDALIDIG